MYPYESNLYLKQVALNVADMQKALLFYRDVLGMTLLEESKEHVLLGTQEEPLVELFHASDTTPVKASYGLYHMAILLPSRQDLSDILKRIIELKIPMVGGADHGYSEALYLEDFEGNGIELYRDKPVLDWDIREDGRIVGVTEELDGESLYQNAQLLDPYHLPAGSRMGHVHLQVKDSKISRQFYQDVLLLEDKFSVATGSWLAQGNYHHHLAVNEWAGKQQLNRTPNMLGLAYYLIQVPDKETLLHHFKNAQTRGASVSWIHSNLMAIRDAQGIETRVGI
ncbi:VOC family protein [Streptococcus sp. DD13]|uniref:VOC family protein n=1 Tax=Streptococcus sp. DD13 TaxID=1777881 RepID=UPI0007930E91|nr:VOC family protein [Streptococcus sp. DD13]KXT78164.1 Glyoxalase family protein [Streptococcus sp. DD13]